MKTGIIVLGHGSKAPEALQLLQQVAVGVEKSLPQYPVCHASMEFNDPDLPEAIKLMVDKGVTNVIIAPYFLYFGIHMQKDIPQIIAEEQAKYPGLQIVFAKNLGFDQRLVDVIVDRVGEVI